MVLPMRISGFVGLILCVAAAGLQAQTAPSGGVVTLIENDRVLIRMVTWEQGSPNPTLAGAHDAVIVAIGDGSATFRAQGAGRVDLPVTEAFPRAVVIELKSSSPAGRAPAPGYPSSFPRSGARQLIDNDLVNVWNVTWPKDQPTVMHTHPFPTVSVTLAGGRQRETRLDGTSSERAVEVGEVRYSEASRVHQEEGLSDPPRRAVIVELK